VPGLTLAILNVLLGCQLRLVVLGEVDRYDVTIGSLTRSRCGGDRRMLALLDGS
jgi:hypothetical protein